MNEQADEVVGGNSAEQRAAEVVMLESLARDLGVRLVKKRLVDIEGARAELDGECAEPPVLVEAWAHQGPPKSAQKAKIMMDALKLLWADSTFYSGGARKILLLSDPTAAAHFRGTSWMAAALKHFNVEIRTVELPGDHRDAVRLAQKRQFR